MNTHPDTGVAYGLVSSNDLDPELVDTLTRLVTITEGVATLEDGTMIDLAPMQDYLAGCFTTTGYQPYADMADQLARLTGIEWREQ